MGLGAFNRMRMRQVEAMKAENIREALKKEEEVGKDTIKLVETPKDGYKQPDERDFKEFREQEEEKTTLGPRKRKPNKE